MNRSPQANSIVVERERMRLEYKRREREIASDIYAPWQTAFRFMADERNRVAAWMLHQADAFPKTGDQCLEIGFGTAGWLSELIGWGVRESDLHGIELDLDRARKTRELLPAADLRTGDAVALPWEDATVQLVITSTLFTSILDQDVRRLIANEIVRVLASGGALLWYDFAYNNPRNPNVRGIGRSEIKRLFPALQGRIRSVTLAPPLSRLIAPRSWPLATLLGTIPLLRTHLLGVLVKDS